MGHWIVSERLLDIFQQFDPDGIACVEVDCEHDNGERYPHKVYWMDIVRGVHAVDLEASNVRFEHRNGRLDIGLAFSLATAIRHNISETIHVFREGGWNGTTFVSKELQKALKGTNVKNNRFRDVAQSFGVLRDERGVISVYGKPVG